MDLIKIHERAKEAGINIDIRISGSDIEIITIEGRTITDDYYDSECYARSITIQELKSIKLSTDEYIELAMDEIISNLRPETKLDWKKAEEHLQFMIGLYQELGMPGVFGLVTGLRPLEARLLDGERTKELYDEIMALE